MHSFIYSFNQSLKGYLLSASATYQILFYLLGITQAKIPAFREIVPLPSSASQAWPRGKKEIDSHLGFP